MKLKLKRKPIAVALSAILCFGVIGATDFQSEKEVEKVSYNLPIEVCGTAEAFHKTAIHKAELRLQEEKRILEAQRKEAERLAEEQRLKELSSRSQQQKPTFRLSESERRVVECMVQGEAGGESYKGKQLVALCILNGCIESNMQPSQVRKQYKYSGWNTNVSEETKKAVQAVFDNGEKITDKPIIWFYAPKHCKGGFHESQTHVITEGGHKFFMRNP